jgi:response regulator of citrate/malate metabolism
MKKYTWKKLLLKLLLRPVQLIKFLRLPRNYKTLDEWLKIDEQKCEIVAKIIECKNVESLKQQQRENMRYRKTITNSFQEWINNFSKDPKHSNMIDEISSQYASRRMCHRKYSEKDAGIVCYCK